MVDFTDDDTEPRSTVLSLPSLPAPYDRRSGPRSFLPPSDFRNYGIQPVCVLVPCEEGATNEIQIHRQRKRPHRVVAVKIALGTSPGSLMYEIQLLRDFLARNRRIVEIFFEIKDRTYPVMAMEYCNGGSMQDLIEYVEQIRYRFPADMAMHLLLQLGQGLAFLHRSDVVKGDGNIANYFLTIDNPSRWPNVKYADFDKSSAKALTQDEPFFKECGWRDFSDVYLIFKLLVPYLTEPKPNTNNFSKIENRLYWWLNEWKPDWSIEAGYLMSHYAQSEFFEKTMFPELKQLLDGVPMDTPGWLRPHFDELYLNGERFRRGPLHQVHENDEAIRLQQYGIVPERRPSGTWTIVTGVEEGEEEAIEDGGDVEDTPANMQESWYSGRTTFSEAERRERQRFLELRIPQLPY